MEQTVKTAAERAKRRDGYPIKVPFSVEEEARFRAFLQANDKKAGRFLRTLVLRELDAAEGPVRLELGGNER
jgi:hypothetical protein